MTNHSFNSFFKGELDVKKPSDFNWFYTYSIVLYFFGEVSSKKALIYFTEKFIDIFA